MSPRSLGAVAVIALALALACGSSKSTTKEPRTAKEKQLQEARASGELDGSGGKWAGWRYQGDRGDCFFVLGRKCYKTEEAACQVARCKAPKKCAITGGGPATVSCK